MIQHAKNLRKVSAGMNGHVGGHGLSGPMRAGGGTRFSVGELLRYYYGSWKRNESAAYAKLKRRMHALAAEAEARGSSHASGGASQAVELADGNADECYQCRGAGELLCCDTCERAWHLRCVELTAVPDGDWSCPVCVRGSAPTGADGIAAGHLGHAPALSPSKGRASLLSTGAAPMEPNQPALSRVVSDEGDDSSEYVPSQVLPGA